ncbi:hypothetical protein ATM97_07130 [Nocardia sp. MH4]|uniref:hypothetical protein n=1 Tax=Nocardia sp. MH4 TaxID=1768677 RepID=UPI001C4FC3BC|nr:hypothetical protein [Nocardia sp. MH4]MBW0270785.1 hypothetical protein [Nocardia sp. MH4]
MGVYATVELFGCDGSYFCLSGAEAGNQGVVLETGPQGLYDAPVKVMMKRGAFEVGGKPAKVDRPYRELDLSLGAFSDDPEDWAEIDSALRMALDYEVDPWDPDAKPARLSITTDRSGTRSLDVLLLDSPIMAMDTDPWDYSQSSLPAKLVASQPMWYEPDWLGDDEHPAGWQMSGGSSGSGEVWVCNPTDRPMLHTVVVTGDGRAHIADFSWTGPKGARVPGVDFRSGRDDSDRMVVTMPIGAVNGHGLTAHVDRMRIPFEDFTGTNVVGLMHGNRLLYAVPPYTPWTALPVAASEVTSATFGILFRQPRLWSRPWGLEKF